MYKINDLNEIEKYYLNIKNNVRKKINDSDLYISIYISENKLTYIKIKSLSKNENIINYIIKNPTIKSIKDDEIENLSNIIVTLYNKSKEAYYFYLSDILKKIKLSDILIEFHVNNKSKNSYRDQNLSPYIYQGSYDEKTYDEIYSKDNLENKLKIVEETDLNTIKDIYLFLKKCSKKKTSTYKANNIWNEDTYKNIANINFENLDNIKFINTISTSLSLTSNKKEIYKYVLKNLIISIYNKKEYCNESVEVI